VYLARSPLGRRQKNGSFGFAKRWLRVSGQNQMCRLCGWLKLFLKKCGGGKNKKHRVGLSVGLLAVPLQYGLYVFGHLSKWFVFVNSFMFLVVCLWLHGRLLGLLITADCELIPHNPPFKTTTQFPLFKTNF